MINLIWAMDINWLPIGKDNKLPLALPRRFTIFSKKMTHHKTVLMGDNTYDSFKRKVIIKIRRPSF